MSASGRFASTTILMAVAKGMSLFPSVLLIPIYTRFIDSAEYGRADLVLTYLGLVAPIIMLRTDMAVLRLLVDARDNQDTTRRVVSTGLALAGGGLAAGAIIFVLLTEFIHIGSAPVVAATLVVSASATLLGQILRGMDRNVDYVVAAGIGGLIMLISGVILVTFLGLRGDGILLAWASGQSVSALWMIVRCKLWTVFSPRLFDRVVAKELLIFGLPLVPEGILWWIMQVSDRTVVSVTLGFSANGIYSVACRFAGVVNGVVSVLWMAWTQVSIEMSGPNTASSEYSRILDKFYLRGLGSVCVTMTLVVCGVFDLMVGPEYKAAYQLIPPLIFAAFLSGILGFYAGLFAAGKMTGRLALSDVAPTVVCLVILFGLLKPIGLWAAVVATVVSYGLTVLIRYHMIQAWVTIRLPLRSMAILIVEFAAASAFYYIDSIPIRIVAGCLCGIAAVMLNAALVAVVFQRWHLRRLSALVTWLSSWEAGERGPEPHA